MFRCLHECIYGCIIPIQTRHRITCRYVSLLAPRSVVIRSVSIMNSNRVAVNVHEGELIGIIEEGIHGGNYIAFRGIPYAKPPVGKLRFKVNISRFVLVNVTQVSNLSYDSELKLGKTS